VRRILYLLRFGLGGDKDRIIEELITRYGPVTLVHPYVLLMGPKANRMLATAGSEQLVNWDNPEFPSLASMDGEVHLRHRKVIMEAFQPRRLTGYVPLMREVLGQRSAGWAGAVDLYEEMNGLALETLLRTMLGIRPGTSEHHRFIAAYWPLIHRADPSWVPFLRKARVARARKEMWALLGELVARRRTEPGDDALSTLVAASDAGRPVSLSDEELVRYAHMLMDFGQGDIAIYLTYVLAVLATRPELRKRLEEEHAGYSDDAVTALESRLPRTFQLLLETERVYAPVTEIHRTAVQDLEFAGYQIPKGCHLVSALRLAHRSAEVFAEPERFDPERFAPPREEHRTPSALMGFGAGRHMCVATVFCRLHAAVVLHALLPRFELHKEGSQSLPDIDYRNVLQRPSEPIRLRVARHGGTE
jgi:cytochrome P450